MEEFLGRMKSLLGGEYEEFLKYYEGENFRGLRVNTLKCTPEKLRELIGFELERILYPGSGAVARQQSAAPLRSVLYTRAVRDLGGGNARGQ